MARGVVVPMKHASVPHKKHRRAAAPKKKDAAPRSGMTRAQLIDESRRWLSIINAHKLNDYKRRKIVTDTHRQLPRSTTTRAISSTASR